MVQFYLNCRAIQNTGHIDNYNNACLWISIYDYLTKIENFKITFEELIQVANYKPNNLNKKYNSEENAVEAYRRVAEKYKIRITIYSQKIYECNGKNQTYYIKSPVEIGRAHV